jgi:hypothetical protein
MVDSRVGLTIRLRQDESDFPVIHSEQHPAIHGEHHAANSNQHPHIRNQQHPFGHEIATYPSTEKRVSELQICT